MIALLARTTDPERRLSVEQQLFPELLNLGTAENILLFPLLNEKVFGKLRGLTEDDLRYPVPIYGKEKLREDIAEMLRPRFGADLDPDDLFGTSGVSAALECLAFALKKTGALATGDRVLLPAPPSGRASSGASSSGPGWSASPRTSAPTSSSPSTSCSAPTTGSGHGPSCSSSPTPTTRWASTTTRTCWRRSTPGP
ncbi:hypothetical protein GCM10020000_12520 [Streptomyces olivoverticillatus]